MCLDKKLVYYANCRMAFVFILGKFGKTWPGLNTPVQVTPRKSKKKFKENYLLKPQMSEVATTRPRKGHAPSSQFPAARQLSKEMPAWKKAFIAGEKMYGQNLSRRGWSGRTWQGREFGPPETAAEGMLCYVMLCYVMLCYVMLCYVMLCYVMLCYVMFMLCYVMLCYVMLCYVMLCYVMLCYVMLCYVMLCYVMLCYVALGSCSIGNVLTENRTRARKDERSDHCAAEAPRKKRLSTFLGGYKFLHTAAIPVTSLPTLAPTACV